ncbi:unnamed protein product [Mucor fragilis]
MATHELLQSLRPVQRTINLSEYRGKTVAVDGPSIFYQAGFGIALSQLFNAYVDYFMQVILLLQYYGVTPIVVFGSLPLPFKQITHDEHCRNPQASLEQGLDLYEPSEAAAAKERSQQPVTATNDMTIAVIRKLKEKTIQCIVAPYEAAAQLTHLAKTGKVAAVVTENAENADLLAFGCPNFIYNLDASGHGIGICMDKVISNSKSPLCGYDAETIRHISILSGCNYLPSIKGVGLKTILKHYTVNKNTDYALYTLQQQFTKDIPVDYMKKFHMLNLSMLHQWVYDMDKQNYTRLNPPTSEYSQDSIQLLGRIPTAQDASMKTPSFSRVNQRKYHAFIFGITMFSITMFSITMFSITMFSITMFSITMFSITMFSITTQVAYIAHVTILRNEAKTSVA